MRSPSSPAFELSRGWRWLVRLLIGAIAAVVLVAVGGLVLRTEPPRTGPGAPVGSTAEDTSFDWLLTTPQATTAKKTRSNRSRP